MADDDKPGESISSDSAGAMRTSSARRASDLHDASNGRASFDRAIETTSGSHMQMMTITGNGQTRYSMPVTMRTSLV